MASPESPDHCEHPKGVKMMSPAQSSLADVRSVPPVRNKMPQQQGRSSLPVARAGQDTGRGSSARRPHLTSPEAPFPHQLGFTSQAVLFALPSPSKDRLPDWGQLRGFTRPGTVGACPCPGRCPDPWERWNPSCLHSPLSRVVPPSLGLTTHTPTVVSRRDSLPADARQM